jgi:hypothetical protein
MPIYIVAQTELEKKVSQKGCQIPSFIGNISNCHQERVHDPQ